MTAQQRKGELFILRGQKVLSYRETANKPKGSLSTAAQAIQRRQETGADSDQKRSFRSTAC